MSRIGRLPIPVPSGVEVRLDPGHVWVKGPKGQLECDLPLEIAVRVEDERIVCDRGDQENKKARALHGLVRALVNNMVVGVTQGFSRVLLLQGVGYRASVDSGRLKLVAGHSHDVDIPIPEGLAVLTEQVTTNPPVHRITISGTDKQAVGQFAANIRALRPVDPYKLKGLRYDNEIVRRKAGKAAGR
jgi:large subunit ribosomal protein L6